MAVHRTLKNDLEQQWGFVCHPKADYLFDLAWDERYLYGLSSVDRRYEDLAYLLLPLEVDPVPSVAAATKVSEQEIVGKEGGEVTDARSSSFLDPDTLREVLNSLNNGTVEEEEEKWCSSLISPVIADAHSGVLGKTMMGDLETREKSLKTLKTLLEEEWGLVGHPHADYLFHLSRKDSSWAHGDEFDLIKKYEKYARLLMPS